MAVTLLTVLVFRIVHSYLCIAFRQETFNTVRPEQNDHLLAEDMFKCISVKKICAF